MNMVNCLCHYTLKRDTEEYNHLIYIEMYWWDYIGLKSKVLEYI